MQLVDLTLPTIEENLALDEALLDDVDAAGRVRETLRIWEPSTPAVVVGRASRLSAEVRLDACRRRGVPVLRRASGGAAVVAGPGCLMYALVLDYDARPHLRAIDQAHELVLSTMARAFAYIEPGVVRRGTSDLAIGERKFSGNSLRCKRHGILYHGTLLYAMDLALVSDLLAEPPRQPEYRERRPHGEFVMNLAAQRDELVAALCAAWKAKEPAADWPQDRVRRLVAEKYSRLEWTECLP